MGRHLFRLPPTQRVLWVLLVIQLKTHGCFSLNGEGMALLRFRSRVEVDPFGALANWDPSDGDPCSWSGIHCIDGKVESLNLTGRSLKGALHPAIGELGHLKYLVIYKNNFSGTIPKEIGQLAMLQLLDLRCNNYSSGALPLEIKETFSHKGILLCGNWIQGCAPSWTVDATLLYKWKYKQASTSSIPSGANSLNRKVLKTYLRDEFKNMPPEGHGEKLPDGLATTECFSKPCLLQNMQQKGNPARRKLVQESRNLAAAIAAAPHPHGAVMVPSSGSGSFIARPQQESSLVASKAVPNTRKPDSNSIPSNPADLTSITHGLNGKTGKMRWLYSILAILVLVTITASMFLVCRKKSAASIVPWKTGLSGHLQKAFITGVTKLNKAELEVACEDFSNIIMTYPEFTLFKGTLSSGVEIAVVSTVIKSSKDWSKHAEKLFRKKVDTLSRINHKNFVNLLGYSEEEEPFMRIMVLEYASRGILHDHLHGNDFEHLDWGARMRIIMGVAYCLTYMHHEICPPVAHSDLRSGSIILTDDYAAKVADINVWKEISAKRNISRDDDIDGSESHVMDLGSNIYSFGMLMLEIISGKDPKREDQDSLLQLVSDYMKDANNAKFLVDPTLKDFKNNELDIVCEMVQAATRRDPKRRPAIKEVAHKLRDVLVISQEAAAPRLSPLWWAELEILSMEAS